MTWWMWLLIVWASLGLLVLLSLAATVTVGWVRDRFPTGNRSLREGRGDSHNSDSADGIP